MCFKRNGTSRTTGPPSSCTATSTMLVSQGGWSPVMAQHSTSSPLTHKNLHANACKMPAPHQPLTNTAVWPTNYHHAHSSVIVCYYKRNNHHVVADKQSTDYSTVAQNSNVSRDAASAILRVKQPPQQPQAQSCLLLQYNSNTTAPSTSTFPTVLVGVLCQSHVPCVPLAPTREQKAINLQCKYSWMFPQPSFDSW